MKVCERCSTEIFTRDGNGRCPVCDGKIYARARSIRPVALLKRDREAALRSLGLVKVRGALGGTYWE